MDVLAKIIHQLPSRNGHNKKSRLHVQTVRMPIELHNALMKEAKARDISVNKLAIAKLSVRMDQLDKLAKSASKETE